MSQTPRGSHGTIEVACFYVQREWYRIVSYHKHLTYSKSDSASNLLASSLAHGLHILLLAAAAILLRNVLCCRWRCCAEHVVIITFWISHAHTERCNRAGRWLAFLSEGTKAVVTSFCC